MSKESANRSELPRIIKPMLAQARSEPFNCDKHLFEVKWDGTRCLSFIEDDRLRLQNRHLIDIADVPPVGFSQLPFMAEVRAIFW